MLLANNVLSYFMNFLALTFLFLSPHFHQTHFILRATKATSDQHSTTFSLTQHTLSLVLRYLFGTCNIDSLEDQLLKDQLLKDQSLREQSLKNNR